MKKIIVLGGNKLHRGFEQIKKKLMIDEIIVIDWNKEPEYCGDKHFQVDIKDFDTISRLDIEWSEVAFVYTSADLAISTQVRLHRMLGLKTPTDLAIKNSITKGEMSECWRKENILNKYSAVITNVEEFRVNNAEKYIFKPNCSSGSRNITILDKEDLRQKNIIKAIEHAKEGSIDNKCIVEEFVQGTEYTVDMLGDAQGNVAVYGISKKYHTVYNVENKIATKLHYAPSDINGKLLEKIAKFGQQCYRAIGLKNSFGHLEVIVDSNEKIIPVEIGARSSGYIATTLLDLINDVCYLGEFEKVLHGDSVKDGITFDGSRSSMYYFYDIKPGRSKCNVNIMDYLPKEIVSYMNDRKNIVKDKDFTVINADHERFGFEILGGPSDKLNIQTIQKAEREFNAEFIGKEV